MSVLQQKFQRARMLHQEGQFPRAREIYEEILAIQPNQLDTLLSLGMLAGQTKDFVRAVRFFEKAIEADPKNPAAYCNRGLALQELGRLDEALASYDKAIALKVDYAVALFNRGNVLKQLGKWGAAVESYDRTLEINPSMAAAHYNRGVLLQECKDWESALASYNRAIALKPDHADAHNNRGIVLKKLNRFDAAMTSFDHAIHFAPDHAEAHLNRGVALLSMGKQKEALAEYDRAIEIRSNYAGALLNRGLLLAGIDSSDESLASYNRAIEIDQNLAEAYSARGVLFEAMARFDDALAEYDRAIELDSDCAQAHFNRSLALLSRGELEAGWIEHEWRWRSEATSSIKERRDFTQPLWLGGGCIAGKTVLIYSEQGLGDTLQFCRYIKSVADLGAKVVFEVQIPLIEALTHLEGVWQLVARGDSLPAFDYQCPLMSLPLAFKTVLDRIPAPARYLHADETRAAVWRAKLFETARPKVGLAWSGSATHGNDRHRSIPLADWVHYLPTGYQYVCIQNDLRERDRKTLQSHPEILVYADELTNFRETAALCDCMDLVISVDTSLAHLSGALGKETWVLLPSIADWRWLRDRNDSPWYPTARLFRQEKKGDWTGVFERIKAGLIKKYGS